MERVRAPGGKARPRRLDAPVPPASKKRWTACARAARLGVVTSKRPESYARTLRPLRWTAISTSHYLRRHPSAQAAPGTAVEILERAGVGPAEALYVGDSVYDRDCAPAAGVDFALAVWGSARPEMENVTWRLNAPEDLLAIFDT